MKFVIFILTLSTFSSATAQDMLDAPSKKSTTIVVLLGDTAPEDAYRMCANILQDQGWQLENTDAMLLSMISDWKSFGGFLVKDWQASISIRQIPDMGTAAYLKCKTRYDAKSTNQIWGINKEDNYEYQQIEKRSNMGKDWEKMEKLANLIGNEFKFI